MNLLLSVNNLGLGGVTTYVAHLAQGLSVRHRVVVFDHYPYDSDYAAISSIAPGLAIENAAGSGWKDRLAWRLNGILERTGWYKNFWEKRKNRYLRKVLRRYAVDVIISFDRFSDRVVAEHKPPGIPLVLSLHGSYDISEYQTLSEPFIRECETVFRTASAIVYKAACNIRILEHYRELNNLREVRRVFHGYTAAPLREDPLVLRHRLGIPPEAFVFGMVARGVPEKGWKEALEAFLLVKAETKEEIHFVAIGGSVYLSRLQAEYGNHPALHFTGFVEHVRDWINLLDVGLLPTYAPTENFTFSVVEYLSLGKPSVVSYHGEIPVTLEAHGEKAGILVPLIEGRPDIQGFARGMITYLRDRNTYLRHQALAPAAMEKFSSEQAVRAYEEVLLSASQG